MANLIEMRRRRVAQTFLNSLRNKTGAEVMLVKLPAGRMKTVELNADSLVQALIKLFESMVYETNKRSIAESHISEHYSACMSTNLNRLSPMGAAFMNDLVSNLAELEMKETAQ